MTIQTERGERERRTRRLPPTADRPKTQRESIVEGELVKRVRAAWGGMAFKLAPTTPGLPDRLVVLPGGRLVLVEVKAEGGQLSPVQVAMHARLADLGIPVEVVEGRQGVSDFMDRASLLGGKVKF